MKINNCKLCEIFDNQKLGGLNTNGSSKANTSIQQQHYCQHNSLGFSRDTLSFLSPHIRDMILATQILRGYYQPAGPLISTHLLQPQPIPQQLENEQLSQQSQSSQSSTPSTESQDNDVLITGDHSQRPQAYRYGPPPPDPGLYSRPVHQMHCPPYPNYYPYQPPPPPQDICYSPSYQPYYPPKIYQNAPPQLGRYYRPNPGYYPPPGDLYDRPPQSVPPPQSGQLELVSAGPSGQHMDHYPGPNYYTAGYSPGGGGYNRPPYLDSPQYHNSSCPCPMQSCPKNVHTGPIIGSKTSKGPVSSTHMMTAPKLDTSLTTTPSTVSNKVSCKIENILSDEIVIKPENDHKLGATDCKDKQQNYEQVALAPHANYSMLEPEMSISPARGSTGLPLLPVQSPAVQPIENNISNSDNNLNINNNNNLQRKARIGKSMERERQMMMMNGYQNSISIKDPKDYQNSIVKQEFELKQENAVKKEKDYESDVVECIDDKMDIENVKIEPESQQEKASDISNDDVTIIENSSESSCKRKLDVIELSDSSTIVDDVQVGAVKRRKLLEKPVTTVKKSPPNSYKSLIKRPNPPSFLTPSKSKLINITSMKSTLKYNTILKSNRMRVQKSKRKLLKSRRNQKANKRRRIADKMAKEKNKEAYEEVESNENQVDLTKDTNETNKEETEIPLETKETKITKMSNIDLTIDRVAKGYFSESEILSSVSNCRIQKLKKQDKRSKSEVNRSNKKPEPTKKISPLATTSKSTLSSSATTSTSTAPVPTDEKSAKETSTKKNKKKKQTNNNNCNNCVDKNQIKNTKSKSNKNQDDSKSYNNKKSKLTPNSKKKVKKPAPLETDEEKSNATSIDTSSTAIPSTIPKRKYNKTNKKKIVEDKKESLAVQKEASTSSSTVTSATVTTTATSSSSKPQLDETDVANNNNECCENNNKFKEFAESISEAVKLTPKTPRSDSSLASVYSLGPKSSLSRRNKKGKFGSKKRHRQQLLKDLDDLLVPKKSNTIPRWSNGWFWDGEPFQAYVFLNSDDPPVVRTCYSSMRHCGGDIIKPRDCVLLRASNKRNELPYVAKVAQLWENPEDGEMMMSLLWYYRPEHTEQGRQPIDAIDEVFASRHKDHNSVACIEDKCYVLTFQEYCRYRRQLKRIEENVEEAPSIVPKLQNHSYNNEHRIVPPNTSPELVMFCKRVWDYRLKRMKPNLKDS